MGSTMQSTENAGRRPHSGTSRRPGLSWIDIYGDIEGRLKVCFSIVPGRLPDFPNEHLDCSSEALLDNPHSATDATF